MGVAPHVHGLLLAPHELGIGVAPQLPLHQIKGEGAQLRHTTLHVSCTMLVLGGGVGVMLRDGVRVGMGLVLRDGVELVLRGGAGWVLRGGVGRC